MVRELGSVHEATATRVEWVMDDYFSLVPDDEEYYSLWSPPFSLAGCEWRLRVCPKRGEGELWLFTPRRPDPGTSFRVAIKRADGTLDERDSGALTFNERTNFLMFDFETPRQLRIRQSELVPSGRLTITCRAVTQSDEQEAAGPSPKVDTRQQLADLQSLSSDFRDLLDDRSQSDVTIHVQEREYRAHRTVLVARSSVFRAMFGHDTEEARSGVLRVPDCDPDSFGDFLSFLYTGRTGDVTFDDAYHLYSTADKYDVQGLKSLCLDYMKRNLTPQNVCDAVTLADRYGDEGLVSSVQEFFNAHHLEIFPTSEWTALMRDKPHLADKLLKGMASSGLKRDRECGEEHDCCKKKKGSGK